MKNKQPTITHQQTPLKCHFCIKAKPNGECFWNNHACAEDDCEKAIKQLTKGLARTDTKTLESLLKYL